MDMTLSEEQRDLVRLASEILGDAAGRGTRDADLWRSLSRAGLLGAGVPEEFGGLGLGFVEVGLLLEEAGRTAASVPLQESLGMVGMAVRDLGRPDQRRSILSALAAGEAVLAPALTEPSTDPLSPLLCAAGDPDRWLLNGTKDFVLSSRAPTHFLVSAHLAGVGPRLLALGADREGLRTESRPGAALGRLTFEDLPIGAEDVLGELAESGAVPVAVRYATAATCAVMAGVLARVVRLTADYASTREQFGRPIGSFQAVGQRAADAFTAAWSVELTARQACWCLGDGRDGAAEVAVAKYIAATAGAEVSRAAHHLHGGIGMDRGYPLHRYTALAKRLELLLGGASEQAAALGDVIARQAVSAASAPAGA
jgi:alkylation response protein AidB-like acyl-CoA dehydrogenase